MDTTARRRKIQKTIAHPENDLYNHDVNMYSERPQTVINLEEFEELALERLQLLRIIEQASLKGFKQYSEDWKKTIKEDLAKSGLKKYIRLINGYCTQTEQDIQARRADHYSHFILRLAYCRSEDLRRWFINREMEWFKLRFISQSQEGIMKFLQQNNLTYAPISNELKDELKCELVVSTSGITEVSFEGTDFYKVPFGEVVPLVKGRKVFIQKGYAFIPTADLVVCVLSKFRAQLSESLNIYNHRLPSIDDDRVNSLLNDLHNTYTGKEYVAKGDKDRLDPAHLDAYSKKHFPLCMRNNHEVLRSTHHLKHFSRLQYGLFLKGIGLLYEDAMEFWREEFTKIMDGDKFDKQYTYNIRYNYGKAGKQVDFSPYSCTKIIMNNVGPGEHHGCPFRHWDLPILKQKMGEYGVSSEGIDSVLDLAKAGHYQIACGKYFEYTHNQPPSMTINHPNQYFEESMNLAKEKSSKKT
ncbi:DNA primase large subunit [Anoplophora glabripennis]|uniref:DNA primase large subunit n=1 Tax=Anoplophora glabripennis TaxID=217634 RepID=UPI0008754917|nr:DNA primase large subunit [Anoplophora glabripennis]